MKLTVYENRIVPKCKIIANDAMHALNILMRLYPKIKISEIDLQKASI